MILNVELKHCRILRDCIRLKETVLSQSLGKSLSQSAVNIFMIPLTKSLAVDVKLPALKVTVPESSVARFFKVSVWMWPWASPISLKGLFSNKLPSSHHCTLLWALPESWQEKVAHSPTKTSVDLRPETMKTSFAVEWKI